MHPGIPAALVAALVAGAAHAQVEVTLSGYVEFGGATSASDQSTVVRTGDGQGVDLRDGARLGPAAGPAADLPAATAGFTTDGLSVTSPGVRDTRD